ncbi:hypothetical protein ABZ639_16145 [Saccharomonospora sp. NPDC006951]
MSDDPERLLAEALRAQARHAPPQQKAATRWEPQAAPSLPPVVETPGGYGLLSGAGEGSLERERAALDALAAEQPPTITTQSDKNGKAETHDEPLALRWIVLLTVLLGLAAGAVAGLLTLV